MDRTSDPSTSGTVENGKRAPEYPLERDSSPVAAKPRAHRNERLVRTLSLLLMALATLGSAWSGFQSGLWNGIQTFRLADSTKASRLSSQGELIASQQRTVDAAIFVAYARAMSEHNTVLAEFLHDRMRPEFRPAMDAWLATKPMKTKNAPASPFDMAEYHLRAEQQAANFDVSAGAFRAQAQGANSAGDSYTLAVLLFTSALFLAGLVTTFDDVGSRWTTIALSSGFIVAACFILFSLPVAHSG